MSENLPGKEDRSIEDPNMYRVLRRLGVTSCYRVNMAREEKMNK